MTTNPQTFIPIYRSIMALVAGMPATEALNALTAVTAEVIFECVPDDQRPKLLREIDERTRLVVRTLKEAAAANNLQPAVEADQNASTRPN